MAKACIVYNPLAGRYEDLYNVRKLLEERKFRRHKTRYSPLPARAQKPHFNPNLSLKRLTILKAIGKRRKKLFWSDRYNIGEFIDLYPFIRG